MFIIMLFNTLVYLCLKYNDMYDITVFGLGVFSMALRHALVSLRHAALSQRHAAPFSSSFF